MTAIPIFRISSTVLFIQAVRMQTRAHIFPYMDHLKQFAKELALRKGLTASVRL